MSDDNSTSATPYAARFILSAADIEAMAGTPKVHFLNPNGRRVNKSLGDATGLTGFGVHLIEVPVGADSTEYHRHYQEDECVYVLAGRAVVTLDEQPFELGPGDFVGLPAGGPAHVFHNPGPDVLRCLVVGARLAHDVGDYPRLGKRLYRNDGTWNLVDLQHVVDPKASTGGTVGGK
ncbi:MAG: cupin domain-containing protein [Myxococcales bacterium]|nr:cupin domain-containing protein [Myxococcales bacterium]MCB9626374.1 cupin domain-containing protein [Sandaracinaceae bacterium]